MFFNRKGVENAKDDSQFIYSNEPLQAYSTINPNYLTSKDDGIIGIYESATSRTIYIELGDESRELRKYYIQRANGAHKACDEKWHWEISTIKGDLNTKTTEVAATKSVATIIKEIQLKNEDITCFKNIFDEIKPDDVFFDYEQDELIEKALKRINKTNETIQFHKERCCSFL